MLREADLRTESGLAEFLRSYPSEMALSEEDAGTVFDRYHGPDVVYVSDGLSLDREKLVAHVGAARKNVVDLAVDVHEVVVGDGRVAACYTLAARMRKGKEVATTVAMFADLGVDGRIRRVLQLTKDGTPS